MMGLALSPVAFLAILYLSFMTADIGNSLTLNISLSVQIAPVICLLFLRSSDYVYTHLASTHIERRLSPSLY